MQRTLLLTAFFGSAILAFSFSACRSDERIHSMGPEVTADLIVYFNTDATSEQIEGFWDNVLKYSDPNSGGQFLRPGVGRLSRVEAVECHEGIAVIFFSDASDVELTQLRHGIDASPLVFTVLENVAPVDVKTLRRN